MTTCCGTTHRPASSYSDEEPSRQHTGQCIRQSYISHLLETQKHAVTHDGSQDVKTWFECTQNFLDAKVEKVLKVACQTHRHRQWKPADITAVLNGP
jgi:hypothetical protein